MKTEERCLAIQDLKQTVKTAKKALPSAIPLVKDTLTNYALRRYLLQVDMRTTMYEVEKHEPSKLGVAAPSALDHGRFDGIPAHSLDWWEPPKDLDNRQFATATVSLLPSTGCAGLSQHLAFVDPLVNGSGPPLHAAIEHVVLQCHGDFIAFDYLMTSSSQCVPSISCTMVQQHPPGDFGEPACENQWG